ncbi:MAG: fumarylacetoacetate hydrolase family protein, partial [Candidatus Methylomirabilis sp.]|nr:fumarylacetoacetate hydrolase family protein [Deltaproteobacteria bacterium]
RKHAAEMGKAVPEEPMLFMKPPSAVVGPGDEIVLPKQSRVVHHEGELAAVIGTRLRNVDRTEARAGILGWTCLNDVSARDLQKKDVQYTRAKGFDTFCPIGPCIARGPGIDPERLSVRTFVNGEPRQDGSTDDLIWSAAEVVRFVASVMTLRPGDVVSTGTPSGVGPLAGGDVVRVEIPGIGALENPVVSEAV